MKKLILDSYNKINNMKDASKLGLQHQLEQFSKAASEQGGSDGDALKCGQPREDKVIVSSESG